MPVERVALIQLDGIQKSFGELSHLSDVTFRVAPGERVSLVGPGGCGKTTVLKIILGLVAPDAGTVTLMGQSLADIEEEVFESLMKRLGMAFQQGGLFDFMTVRENLRFAMEHMTNLDSAEMDSRSQRLLEVVKLGRTERMYPHELSGGMKRRVGIVRALCTDPDVAIFDEPTSGLDPVTSTIILQMILGLASENKERSLVVATSNVETAVRFADRVLVLHEGRIVADGPWRNLLLEGSDWVRHFLGVRFIGLDLDYARELDLPEDFVRMHWKP